MLTLNEVCEELRCSAHQVKRYVANGHLKCFRVGKDYRFRRKHLERFLRREEKHTAKVVEAQRVRKLEANFTRWREELCSHTDEWLCDRGLQDDDFRGTFVRGYPLWLVSLTQQEAHELKYREDRPNE